MHQSIIQEDRSHKSSFLSFLSKNPQKYSQQLPSLYFYQKIRKYSLHSVKTLTTLSSPQQLPISLFSHPHKKSQYENHIAHEILIDYNYFCCCFVLTGNMRAQRNATFNRKEVGRALSPQYKISMKSIGRDVIDFYKRYENKKTNWAKTYVNGQIFRLPEDYEIYKQIGTGSYGAVVGAIDTRLPKQSQEKVAIKKMTNVFQHKIFCRRILRELRILRLLKLQNIIDIKTIILPKSREYFNEIYVVFSLMDFDMGTILRSPLLLDEEYCQFYLYQILRGLKFIHSANIMHRDLKPRNILIDDNNDLKICDFGLSRFTGQSLKSSTLTEYVTTRWYRAPEILLGSDHYTPAVDIWSTGCIFAQILTKKPFLQASSTRTQLQLIMKTLQVQYKNKKFVDVGDQEGSFIDKQFPKLSPNGLDLLKKMLKFNQQDRITAVQALSHPYFKHLHVEEDEPTSQPISQLEFQFQEVELTIEQLKDILYEEILLYHFEDFRKEYELKKKQKKSLIKHIIENSNSKLGDPDEEDDST